MSIRVGVDLVMVARIAQQFADGGRRFSEGVWTAAELQYCQGNAEKLAGRWAAKEAILKVLGLGLPDIYLTDIEVRHSNGQPVVRLSARAQERADALGIQEWSLSISHDGGMAIAMVAGVSV